MTCTFRNEFFEGSESDRRSFGTKAKTDYGQILPATPCVPFCLEPLLHGSVIT